MTNKLKPHDLLLMLLYAGNGNKSIEGVTRLTKLLFLLQNYLGKTNLSFEEFEYIPYKMGPFSDGVYASINFLENFKIPLIESESSRLSQKTLNPEEWQIFDDYLDDPNEINSNEFNKVFKLTTQGEAIAKYLWENELNQEQRGIFDTIRKDYGRLSLKDLLRFVYKEYPKYTVKSEIKHTL